ncbi:MAG: glutamyl-tRNA reductase [Planctomycetes bacterium GWF2_42_9]|nr:MAG: glutamyl-tRNA reductase [Planctomycetes bacterium GWF2_42_9]HAL44567.1 glutamyl-tRNA reductase [Phycisphaerales bacterium]
MILTCQSVNFSECSGEAINFVLDKCQQENFLSACEKMQEIGECLILNTCNRLEFYFYARENFDVLQFIADTVGSEWAECAQNFEGIEAARHLFRVAAGLESQIIGENEIFAQLKAAYSFALDCGTIKTAFHHLFHSAFRVAKAVRSQTDISSGALSIAGAAIAMAQINCEIEKAKVFVVGSGANAELLVKHLAKRKVKDVTVVARNHCSAMRLIGKTSGKFMEIDGLAENILQADVVFTATSSKSPLIREEMIKERSRPLVLIDVCVPPNVDAGENANVKYFNIESLNEIIETNNNKRKNEIPKAQAIVNQHLTGISEWLENKHAVTMVD